MVNPPYSSNKSSTRDRGYWLCTGVGVSSSREELHISIIIGSQTIEAIFYCPVCGSMFLCYNFHIRHESL